MSWRNEWRAISGNIQGFAASTKTFLQGVIALFPILGYGEKTCESQVGRGLSACEKTVACQGDTFDAMVEVHTTIIALTRSPLYDPSYAYQSPVDNHPPALSRAAVGLFGAWGEAD